MIAIGLWFLGFVGVVWLIGLCIAAIGGSLFLIGAMVYAVGRIVYFGLGPMICLTAVLMGSEGIERTFGSGGVPADRTNGFLWCEAAIVSLCVGVLVTKIIFGLWGKSQDELNTTEPFIVFRIPKRWRRLSSSSALHPKADVPR
jgi:hypothetical protein